jgi:UDP-N-acetylmuramate--alanine ligase
VVSTDIPKTNPEYMEALRLGIPLIKRAQMLGELMRWKFGISITGTHGKTTTTSMIATLLDFARFDPTVVNGGIINSYGTNARLGEGEWIVVEADESDGSFIHLPSVLSVVTNIDLDHMSHYKTEENLMNAFSQFLERLPFWGTAIVYAGSPRTQALISCVNSTNICTYGLEEGVDIRGINVEISALGARFDVEIKDKKLIEGLFLPMVGMHNVQNALAVIAVAQQLKIPDILLKQSLATFSGVKRRFTNVGIFQNATVIDDYAHHPVEISAVLKAARTISKRKVIAVFQPHRYSRFENLYADFKVCFQDADQLLVAPVYSAGEDPIPGISHEIFAKDVPHPYAQKVDTIEDVVNILENHVSLDDLVVFLGAGSITHWAREIKAT